MILLSKTYSALCRKLSTAETVLGSLGAAACVVLSLFDALSPISTLALAGCRIVSSLVLYFVSRSRFGPAADFGEADRAEPDPPKSNDEEKEQHVAVIP